MRAGFSRRKVLRGMMGGAAISVGLPLLDCFLNSNGTALADAYRLLGVPDAAGGRHTATATVRELSTGKLSEQTIEYFV